MKPLLLCAARLSYPLAIAAVLAAPSAQAITYYWDNNGTTTGFGSAGGTWQIGTVSQWSTGTGSTTGVATPGVSVTTTTSDALNFGQDTSPYGLGGGTITITGTVNAASLRFGNQTTSNVTLSGGTINLAAVTSIHVGAGSSTVHTISSTITGAGTSLTKTGNTLTLSGANTYTGSTIISTGILNLANVNALGTIPGTNGTSGITINAGATLSGNVLNDNTIVSAPITLGSGGNTTLRIGVGASGNTTSLTLNGAIGGATNNLVFSTNTTSFNNGASVFVLGAAGTYTGNTIITTGNGGNNPVTVRAGTGIVNALPVTTVLSFGQTAGGGSGRNLTYDLNGNDQTLAGLNNALAVPVDRNFRVSSTNAATLTINNTADFTFGGATLEGGAAPTNNTTTSAQITGAIALTKSGSGTFTLGGVLTGGVAAQGNTFTGATKILGGILVLGETNSIRNSAFDTAGSIPGTAGDGLRTTVTTLTLGGLTGGNDFATRFTSTTGGYTGLTALTLNPGTGVTHSYAGDVGDGATGMILNKTGAGTQVLTGTNTHTGTTTVSAGVLAVNGSLANTSATTVSGTGTLKGSGTIASTLTIGSGGTLASGTSIESLAVGGNLSFTTGSKFEYELDKDVAAGVAGDLTAVTGDLSLTGTVTLNLLETGTGSWELGTPVGDHFGITPADKITLISYTGTWNGGLFTYLGNVLLDDSYFLLNGQQWLLNYNDTDAGTNFTGDLVGANFVTMTVPEPGAALLGGLGLLALLRRRR